MEVISGTRNTPKKMKFNKFFNSNADIFLHYNKKFQLPKCVKLQKECSCFMYKNEINFSFEYPLSAIQLLKNHLRKTLCEIEKHNNHYVISLSENGNYTKKRCVRRCINDHKSTLKIFKVFYKKKLHVKKKKHFIRYMIYINNQMSKCEEFLSDMVPWEDNDYTPIFTLISSLYAHYHTLKLFEKFCVIKK
jgi:hypothetical protein